MNNGVFYTPIFDNLDSNVVWFKILAQSKLIFAQNNALIPNMMDGLPRFTYSSEFNMLLWLYYFFEPKTAYIINEILIHIVAFFSMLILLKNYFVSKDQNRDYIVYIVSIYFMLLPFWSAAGLTLAIVPLVTYSLLNIGNNKASKYDWTLLIVLPLYTSFIFFYMFYILLWGCYLLYRTLKTKEFPIKLFLALFLMGILFLLTEYRLLLSFFSDETFISHRTEFQIFFQDDFLSVYRKAVQFFISGHLSHASALQTTYILPFTLIAMFLTLTKKRFNSSESLIITFVIFLSFATDFWQFALTQIYTLPIILLFTLFVSFKAQKRYALMPKLMILQIVIVLLAVLQQYKQLDFLGETFAILKSLNITRVSFIQPLLVAVLFALSISAVLKKVKYASLGVTLLILFQINLSLEESFYQEKPKTGFASFEDYYAQETFDQLKSDLNISSTQNYKFVSYGLEPAVLLYNNLHTVDGYSVNYPLEYKKKFRPVISSYLKENPNNLYDKWGSKVYILSVVSLAENYNKKLIIQNPSFSTQALCSLHCDYIISAYKIGNLKDLQLKFLKSYESNKSFWSLYLYKIDCK